MVAVDKRKGVRRDQEEDSPLDKKQTAAIWYAVGRTAKSLESLC